MRKPQSEKLFCYSQIPISKWEKAKLFFFFWETRKEKSCLVTNVSKKVIILSTKSIHHFLAYVTQFCYLNNQAFSHCLESSNLNKMEEIFNHLNDFFFFFIYLFFFLYSRENSFSHENYINRSTYIIWCKKKLLFFFPSQFRIGLLISYDARKSYYFSFHLNLEFLMC